MARTRYIKPGFFTNEDLTEFGPWHRLLFAGLWVIADRAGRLEDRPKRIKGDVFPHDPIPPSDVDAWLSDLASGPEPFIARYEVAGKRYIQIIKWSGNQRPHSNEAQSVIPPMERTTQNTEQVRQFAPKEEVVTTKVIAARTANGELERELELKRGTGNGEPSPDAPVPPVWRQPGPRPETIIQPRSHHAKCFDAPLACARGLCIPAFLGRQWEAQAASGQPEGYSASGAVIAKINAILETSAPPPAGTDPLPWWRSQWQFSVPMVTTPRPELGAWRDECDREHGGSNGSACGTSQMHWAKMASQRVTA